MRSYQPERSLYAALWCYAHGHAGMQVGSMQSERMQNTHTHSLSLFPSIMFLHDLFFLPITVFFTHTSLERERDCRMARNFGQTSWRVGFELVSGEERGDTEGVVSP